MNVRKRVIEILEDCDFVDDVSTVFEKNPSGRTLDSIEMDSKDL